MSGMKTEQRTVLFPTVSSSETQEVALKLGLAGFQKMCLRDSGEWAGRWNLKQQKQSERKLSSRTTEQGIRAVAQWNRNSEKRQKTGTTRRGSPKTQLY